MIYLRLFWSFFQIGLFSIGGGYAALPLIQNQIVDLNKWLTMKEFSDVITISQMTPGPIAINSATFVGIRIAGPIGAVAATIGCVCPSCIIVLLLAYVYYRYRGLSVIQGILSGLRPAVTAMIASAGISLVLNALWGEGKAVASFETIDWISAIIFIAALVVLRKWKADQIKVMLAAGIIGLCIYPLLH